MAYIWNEPIIGDGVQTEFTLSQKYSDGTCKVLFEGRPYYEYREVSPDKLEFDFPPTAQDKISVSFYTQSDAGHPNALRYATPKQVIDANPDDTQNWNPPPPPPDEAEIEKRIRWAEIFIDGYCGFWDSADTRQKLMFPRKEDWQNQQHYAGVPLEVTKATIFLTDMIGDDDGHHDEIIEEKIGDYSYKRSTRDRDDETVDEQLFPFKILLKGFRKLSGKIKLKL